MDYKKKLLTNVFHVTTNIVALFGKQYDEERYSFEIQLPIVYLPLRLFVRIYAFSSSHVDSYRNIPFVGAGQSFGEGLF